MSLSYGAVTALKDVSFSADPGTLFGVVGPNGGGKSTLLKAMVGLVSPAKGQVRFGGEPTVRTLAHIAYLPQRAALDWSYPAVVRDVVAMGRAPHLGRLRRLSSGDRALVETALQRLRLSDLAERPIGALSAGQQQRALLARALAQQARLLLLDEPFAGVDATTEQLLWRELARLAEDGVTAVIVNHDLSAVIRHCDRLLLLATDVVALGPPSAVCTPANVLNAYGGMPGGESSA